MIKKRAESSPESKEKKANSSKKKVNKNRLVKSRQFLNAVLVLQLKKNAFTKRVLEHLKKKTIIIERWTFDIITNQNEINKNVRIELKTSEQHMKKLQAFFTHINEQMIIFIVHTNEQITSLHQKLDALMRNQSSQKGNFIISLQPRWPYEKKLEDRFYEKKFEKNPLVYNNSSSKKKSFENQI